LRGALQEIAMRYTPFALAALMVLGAACSNDEPAPSFVPEAQASPPPAQSDYGWRTTPHFPEKEEPVSDYN
jgi:hypothetical protein